MDLVFALRMVTQHCQKLKQQEQLDLWSKALCHEESFALQWPRGEPLLGSAVTAEGYKSQEGAGQDVDINLHIL